MPASPELPRRPTLGVRCTAAAAGLRVLAVRPPADAVLRPGDLLLALDGAPLPDVPALLAALRRHLPGDRVPLALRRDDVPVTVTVPLAARPPETCPGGHVLYDMVQVPGARLRAILGVPDGPGPHPAWLLLPGVACASVDLTYNPDHPLAPVVAALTAAGAITLRVDRPGLGDSEGPPCADLDVDACELAAYTAALAYLAADPRVASLALFGHSLGGMLAPLLAARAPVARIAVAGTTAAAWDVCRERALAREAARTGRPIATLRPIATTGRTPAFDAGLARLDLSAIWSAVTADVLVVHGDADDVVDRRDADELVALLARRPRGAVRLLALPGAGHGDLGHPALLAALAAGVRSPRILTTPADDFEAGA